ncbi:MAG TPA: hypothetical protein PLL18_07480 [Flavobacteriales bacterium]|nr:hypothetical protein [Flavobacteriales bacterium]
MKNFLRIIAVPAFVVIAGLLAWQWMTSGQQQTIKEQVKRVIGKSPRMTNGTPPVAADMQAGETGLLTGDPAPFGFATGPWSTVAFEADGHTVRPDLQFSFEVPPGSDTTLLSRQWSHSGARSYRMAAGDEYSPAIRRRVQDIALGFSAVEVGLWAWSPTPGVLVTAVVSIDRDGKQVAWFGKDMAIPEDTLRSGARLNGSFLLRDLALEPTDVVSVYLWKRGGKEAFIDDLDLFFHSGEVPGRKLGQAFPLDSTGKAALGYADVVLQEVVPDPARFSAGAPAVNTTVDAIPIGGTGQRWQFKPDEGVAYLLDPVGQPAAMLRPWSATSGRDITHFDRVVAEPTAEGIRLTGFDVVVKDGEERMASSPAPMAVTLQLAKAP